jgi:hypothetical protein
VEIQAICLQSQHASLTKTWYFYDEPGAMVKIFRCTHISFTTLRLGMKFTDKYSLVGAQLRFMKHVRLTT